jgi:hypothetical protein
MIGLQKIAPRMTGYGRTEPFTVVGFAAAQMLRQVCGDENFLVYASG